MLLERVWALGCCRGGFAIGELYGEQAAWVANKRATVGNKKCLMLTHHQPFSAYEPVAENLKRRRRPSQRIGSDRRMVLGT